MRRKFYDIFKENPDGTLMAPLPVRIGTSTLGPAVRFGPGVFISGINLFDFKGTDIEVEEENGILVLRAFYK